MKAIFLASVVSLSALVSFSQDSSNMFIDEAPRKEWFAIEGEDNEGILFMQDSSDEYIVNYVTEMLAEDSINFKGFREEVIYKPGVYLLEWEYVQISNNKKTLVTYIKEEKYSMITFYEE